MHEWMTYRLTDIRTAHTDSRASRQTNHTYMQRIIPTHIQQTGTTGLHTHIQSYRQRAMHTEVQPKRQAYIHAYILTYRQPYIHTYIQTDRHTYIHTDTYIHTYRLTDIHMTLYLAKGSGRLRKLGSWAVCN